MLDREPTQFKTPDPFTSPGLKDRPAEGYIGFQDEAQPVWYRNVRIKELSPAAKAPE